MKNILRLAIGLSIPIALYSCSGDDEENSDDGTGGEQSKGGSSNLGTNATGGKTSTGTSSVKPSSGGGLNSSGGATSKGGATQTGGFSAVAGQSSVSVAGSSPIVSVGGASAGGAQNIGGVGAAGVAGAGLAGASSTAPQSCDALCGVATSCKPECMDKVFGYGSNTAISLCLPQTTVLAGVVTLCSTSSCGANQPGCLITAVLGTSDWKYAPAGNRTTNVRLDTTIKSITGSIDMSVPNLVDCTVSPVLPSAGAAVAANGTVAPQIADPSVLGVTVKDVEVDLTQLTFSSADAACAQAANAYASNADALTQELLGALQKRAAELKCLECNGGCPQNIACVAP